MEHTNRFADADSPIIVNIDGVNTSRGADQAILYTASFGDSTATNEYGYEITVEDGVISRLGGNDSAIPQNGFVLSLHGCLMTTLRARVTKGMTVAVDEASQTVVFRYTADGLQRAAAYAVDSAKRQIAAAKAAFINADYHAAESRLESLTRGDFSDDSVERVNALIDEVEALCRTLCDSYPAQYRGVWIRPSQKSPEEVDAYIKTLRDARINFVCVEGWFANGTIMALPEGCLFSRHPQFDYDVLRAYTDACHKYNMECHLWMPILNVGSFDDKCAELTPAGRKPEWISLDNHGSPRNPNGFMMIDPANKEACDYLVDFYRYIVTTYDIDCFEVDYIRYYAQSAEADYGYTQAAFEGFENAYGYGVTPAYDPEADYWNDWCRYRRDCVTNLVNNIRAMIDREAPHVLLAADVAFPFSHALNAVYQNFPQWLEDGILDLLHPMAYGDGYESDIRRAVALAGDRCMVVTGLGAQGDLLRTEELERQARENPTYGAYGECYFEANAYFYKHLPPALLQTAYRRAAVSPFRNVASAVDTLLSFMVERIDAVIVPQSGMTQAQATTIQDAVAHMKQHLRDTTPPLAEATALRRAIAAIDNADASRILERDFYRAAHVLCVKHRITFDELTTYNGE